MRGSVMAGVILIVLGIAALVVQNVSFTETKKVVDLGPVQVNSKEEHNIPIPNIAGVIAIIAGLGIALVGARRSA